MMGQRMDNGRPLTNRAFELRGRHLHPTVASHLTTPNSRSHSFQGVNSALWRDNQLTTELVDMRF